MTGLPQAEFGKRLGGIPLRTIQNWESGVRTPPDWVVELITFRVEHDNYLLTELEMLNREAVSEDLRASWNAFQKWKEDHPRKRKTDEKILPQEESNTKKDILTVEQKNGILRMRENAENAPASIRAELLLQVEQFEKRFRELMAQRETETKNNFAKVMTQREAAFSKFMVMKENNNQSVVIYARESKHAGAEESLEKQKEKLRAFCEQNGHDIFGEIAFVENRQDSMHYLKLAIELAKNTEGKTLLMASSDRVVGTHKEITEITDLIESAGVKIATMDGSYEYIQKYGVSFESLIASTLSATDEEIDDE